MPLLNSTHPLRVGIVGTGYAAKLRAAAFSSDSRSQLVAVAGHSPQKTVEFCQTYPAQVVDSWEELVQRPDLDLVVICNINRDHGTIAQAALSAGKHTIVEYPLSLSHQQAESLISLAQQQQRLLHVEHIELLGGLHQALKQHLHQVGAVFFARYSTITPQRPAPQKWTYHRELFGFPFSGALSRIHRLTDLFGTVATVNCHLRYWGESAYYRSCLCTAQLKFTNGILAEVVYGKGENLWQASRDFEVHGEKGALLFVGDEGKFVSTDDTTAIDLGSRRGLFAKDTQQVLDHLFTGSPLYVSPQASLYALQVADAARQSAETGQTIVLSP